MKDAAIAKYKAQQDTPALRAVQEMSNFVNNFNHDSAMFIELMEREHRTLQQSFTKLVLQWLEHIAKPEYHTDGRNIHSKETAQKLMQGWHMLGQLDEKLTYDMPPSRWLPMV
jgi:hypothetical protein